MNELFKRLSEIQRNLKAKKGRYNSFGRYSYRSCEDILEAVKQLLNDSECVTLHDEIVLVGERYYVKAIARFHCGESVTESVAYAREPLDKKGADQSQITGAASSYSRKYALNGLFCIDDGEDADSTNTHGQDQQGTQSTSPPAQTAGKNVGAKASDKQIKLAKFLRDKTGAKVSDAQIMSLDAANMSNFIDKLNARKKELESGAITTDDIPF